MSIVALHFASGGAFFSGAACLVVGMLVATFARRKLLAAIGRLFILAGLILIALSATPLPVWAWCVWGVSFLLWMVVRLTKVAGTLRVPSAVGQASHTTDYGGHSPPYKDSRPPRVPSAAGEALSDATDSTSPVIPKNGCGTRSVPATIGVVACTLAAVCWELRWQLPPSGGQETLRQAGKPDLQTRLVVIGDSLSADDFTEGGAPWPTLLARGHGIEVENLAFSGAKVGSAAKRVASGDFAGAVVLLEIGGNDLLGGTTSAEFERDLESLLAKVCHQGSINQGTVHDTPGPERQAARPPLPALAKGGRALVVVMLELPLPPLYNRFGEIQRRLARRYDVVLIPKRYFASVLIGGDATLDGLHLSPAGHRKMAEMVWEQVSGFVKAK
jgi:lysophospholipase L1-like esterase